LLWRAAGENIHLGSVVETLLILFYEEVNGKKTKVWSSWEEGRSASVQQ
jgi:hypothetical protein